MRNFKKQIKLNSWMLLSMLFISSAIVFGEVQANEAEQESSVARDPNAIFGTWDPDAPYLPLKDKYTQMLSNESKDIKYLSEEYELAMYFDTQYFDGWTNIFGKDAKNWDQHAKAFKLYEHIINKYPSNEYKVLCAKVQKSGLLSILKRDRRLAIEGYLEVILTPVLEVVDSTSRQRDVPLESESGLTQVQMDFKQRLQNSSRNCVINLCQSADYLEAYALLGLIIEKCENVDAEMTDLAFLAKTELDEKILENNGIDEMENIHYDTEVVQ
jgi:hypothetical protein